MTHLRPMAYTIKSFGVKATESNMPFQTEERPSFDAAAMDQGIKAGEACIVRWVANAPDPDETIEAALTALRRKRKKKPASGP